jgi:hypothetical protein
MRATQIYRPQGLERNRMKVSKLAMLAAAAIGMSSGAVNAQQYGSQTGVRNAQYTQQGQAAVRPVSWGTSSCDCGEPVCGCETVADPDSGCETSCDSGCDSMCGAGGLGLGACSLGDCNLGDPFSLFGEYNGFSVGGWTQLGYHSQNSARRFNNHADNVNLHQAWIYAEKAIDTSNGFDIGGRVDYVYGVDAQDTQAFGQESGFDTDWDNGIYGSALPQAYAEVGYGDLSVKVGHFFTLIGYEVVAAPDNFFYSHAYTMYNSEPFTHTGFLATYNATDAVTLYGGYTLGWDSGFEDNGDSFLGGISLSATDDITVTYASIIGSFSQSRINGGAIPQAAPERGYMHSLVVDVTMTDKLNYVFQSDYLDTEDNTGAIARNTFGINQYLLYSISDCWAAGMRAEWYNVNTTPFNEDGNLDVYAATFGLNYRPHANVIIRPEVRWDFVKEDAALLNTVDTTVFNERNRSAQTTFGLDTIFLF